MPTLTITKFIRVVDTREWIEGPDDKWYPVKGSGCESQCPFCNKTHEIHATVLMSDGSEVICGTGCAKKLNPELGKTLTTAENRAKKLKQYRKELQTILEWESARSEARAQVERMTIPAIIPSSFLGDSTTDRFYKTVDDVAMLLIRGGKLTPAQIKDIQASWKRNMVNQLVPMRYFDRTGLERRIAKLESN